MHYASGHRQGRRQAIPDKIPLGQLSTTGYRASKFDMERNFPLAEDLRRQYLQNPEPSERHNELISDTVRTSRLSRLTSFRAESPTTHLFVPRMAARVKKNDLFQPKLRYLSIDSLIFLGEWTSFLTSVYLTTLRS